MSYTGPLTMDERLFIHCYYTTLSRREMAEYLQIPFWSVKAYLDRSNLRITRAQLSEKNKRIRMEKNNSAQFDEFIKANCLEMNYNQLARTVGKSDTFIYNRIKFLGIEIPAEILQKRIQDSWKKKGDVPANKGKKMSAELYERCSATFFKKGIVPHNVVAIGTERITDDGYIEVKVKNGGLQKNWKLKQRLIWEQHNGPIPKGYNIQFKDGNPQNLSIDNLYIISRSDQLKKNGYTPEAIAKRFLKMSDEDIAYAKLHAPGLIEAKATQIKLKSMLNKQQNEVKRSNRTV